MKKICFIISHLGSGSNILVNCLNENSRIEVFRSEFPYVDFSSFQILLQQNHKLSNNAAIYMDELLYNYQLQTKIAYDFCQFVYILRPPTTTLPELVKKMPLSVAMRYYDCRVRRMCEMAKRTAGVLLTWDDMISGRGLPLIEDYLCLKDKINLPDFPIETETISCHELEKNHDIYLSFLKKQKLQYYQ
jgi:hypothetical protein